MARLECLHPAKPRTERGIEVQGPIRVQIIDSPIRQPAFGGDYQVFGAESYDKSGHARVCANPVAATTKARDPPGDWNCATTRGLRSHRIPDFSPIVIWTRHWCYSIVFPPFFAIRGQAVNTQHDLASLLHQSVYSRLADYEDVNVPIVYRWIRLCGASQAVKNWRTDRF